MTAVTDAVADLQSFTLSKFADVSQELVDIGIKLDTVIAKIGPSGDPEVLAAIAAARTQVGDSADALIKAAEDIKTKEDAASGTTPPPPATV